MRRRMIWATAVLAVLLVLPAAPAAAAESELVSPDGEVTGATPLEVALTRDFGAERFNEVAVTLRRDGERVGERVRLTCVDSCDQTDQRATFVLPDDGRLRPRSGAPFGLDEALANGTYTLRVELDRGRFQSAETFEHELRLRVPATAPHDVAAEVEGGEVAVTWTPSPEPDVERYRVERHDGDDWEELATTSEAAATDEPGAGEHRYRVVALRDAGHDGGDGDGGELETPSEEVTVEVEAEAPDGGGSDDNGEGGASNGDGGEAADDGGEDDGQAEQAEASDAGTSDDEQSGYEPRTGRRASPSTGEGAAPRSEDDAYDEELDYGEFEPDRPDEPVEVATPSGWRGTTDRIFDAERVAVPIALGLVMTATGLHLWRWMRIA